MKESKFFFFVLFTVICLNGFGQKIVDVKEDKEYDWGISSDFHSEPGFVGSYWHTGMKVICEDNYQFLLSIYKPASNGYYNVHEDENCYLKLENDSVITLRLNTEYSPLNYERAGYYSGSTYMPKRYFTQTFYNIPDAKFLMRNKVIKLRWIIDNKPYDIDYAESNWVSKFNRRLRNAIIESQKNYEEKARFKNNQLHGF